jgi:hypothetical protein
VFFELTGNVCLVEEKRGRKSNGSKMSSYRSKLTEKLVAPKNKKDFIKDWARRILVDYMCRTDPDWLLGDVLKVIDVTAKDNPHPGANSSKFLRLVEQDTI